MSKETRLIRIYPADAEYINSLVKKRNETSRFRHTQATVISELVAKLRIADHTDMVVGKMGGTDADR